MNTRLFIKKCSGLFSLQSPQTLILVNNQITTIHPKAFIPLGKLQRLYLSKNHLKEMPANMPKSLQELRIHENKITKIKKASFEGMAQVIVMELGSNPLKSAGVEAGAFGALKKVSYIRIADTNLTEIPKGTALSGHNIHLNKLHFQYSCVVNVCFKPIILSRKFSRRFF
ncbi:unnamed protein product [Oncorhynchus mykiss]|uniref:Decorin n=1 Tax=Oncorhynchus mykiss TaxID=8022 RepID=A0A060XQ14_ONCMY|nr:unnamed protein product [Oncorhynchus mykiss]